MSNQSTLELTTGKLLKKQLIIRDDLANNYFKQNEDKNP